MGKSREVKWLLQGYTAGWGKATEQALNFWSPYQVMVLLHIAFYAQV